MGLRAWLGDDLHAPPLPECVTSEPFINAWGTSGVCRTNDSLMVRVLRDPRYASRAVEPWPPVVERSPTTLSLTWRKKA